MATFIYIYMLSGLIMQLFKKQMIAKAKRKGADDSVLSLKSVVDIACWIPCLNTLALFVFPIRLLIYGRI